MTWSILAVVLGGSLGLGFAAVQRRAVSRYQKIMEARGLRGGWVVLPGSVRRVAFLLMALVLVQVLCPMLFVDGTAWWVTFGILSTYGIVLSRQLRERKSPV